MKLTTDFHLANSNLVQINTYYRSKQLIPEGENSPLFFLNLGIRQELFSKKAFLTLTISDIFNTLKRTRKIDTPELYQKATRKRNSQIIYLGLTWRFGKSAKRCKPPCPMSNLVNAAYHIVDDQEQENCMQEH